MTEEELKKKFDTNGLGKYFDKLRPHFRNTIRLYQEESNEKKIAIGQTKIGGKPDLPPGISWPVHAIDPEPPKKFFLFFKSNKENVTEKSLAFIAQINLTETAPFDTEHILPKHGMLYFFYTAEQEAWGFDPKDKDKFKVIYWNGNISELHRTNFPSDLPEDARYTVCQVGMRSEISLPSDDHEVYELFTEEEHETFLEEIYNYDNINKLLGYSDNIQGEMELECELVTNGIYTGDPSGYDNTRAKSLEPNAKHWQLLLQIDSNPENDMMWGDMGRLYYWIKKDDLKNQKFDRSWLILQCS